MHLIEAATLDRKSGEAEGSAVPRTFLGNVFRPSAQKHCSSVAVRTGNLPTSRQSLRIGSFKTLLARPREEIGADSLSASRMAVVQTHVSPCLFD
jgi:hypothetical protein